MAQDSLEQLASDMCNELEKKAVMITALSAENEKLKAQIKEASAKDQEPCVSAEIAHESCEALLKAGALTQDQVAETTGIFMKSPEAAHKILQAVLDAQSQTKNASKQEELLEGGSLIQGRKASAQNSSHEQRLDLLLQRLTQNK